MSNVEIYLAILVMSLVNYFTRIFPFIFFIKKEPPAYILYIEKYFPAVIMMILIFYTLKDISFSVYPFGAKELLGILFTAGVHLFYKNYLVSIFGGTIFYMVMVQFL